MGAMSVLFLMGILSSIFIFFITIFIVIVAYSVMSYVFESMALRLMTKNLWNKEGMRVWIPFYNKSIFGKIVGYKALGMISSCLTLISFLLSMYFFFYQQLKMVLFLVLLLMLIITFILDTFIAHRIYMNVSPRYGDILTATTILSLGLLRPLFLFLVRNKFHDIKTY